jgi:hypothetical protein
VHKRLTEHPPSVRYRPIYRNVGSPDARVLCASRATVDPGGRGQKAYQSADPETVRKVMEIG